MTLILITIQFVQEFKTPVSSRSVSAMTNRFGDVTIGSPTPVRNMETSLSQNVDTEVQVARINAMFPTVSDTHIRLLLKKLVIDYYFIFLTSKHAVITL